jgi:hypothetical protein
MTDHSPPRPAPLAVGDTVYIERHHYGRQRSTNDDLEEKKITKIGRQWITLEGYSAWRFKKGERKIDGGGYSCPGTVWFSKEEFQEAKETKRLWKLLRDYLDRMPDGITRAQIAAALAALSVKTE